MKHLLPTIMSIVVSCGCGTDPSNSITSSDSTATTKLATLTSPVYVELPSGWQPRQPTISSVRQFADYPTLEAHFTLAIQRQAAFNNDLMAFAEATKKATAQQTKLANRTESALRTGRIGTHSVIEYEVSGEAGNSRGMSRVVMVPIGHWFCKVLCWTTPDNWQAAQPVFDELVRRLRTAPSMLD